MVPEAFPLDNEFLDPFESCVDLDTKGCLCPEVSIV